MTFGVTRRLPAAAVEAPAVAPAVYLCFPFRFLTQLKIQLFYSFCQMLYFLLAFSSSGASGQ